MLSVPQFSRAYIILGVEIPRAKIGLILTKLSENSIYTQDIHLINSDSKDARSIKEFVRSNNSNFSFNITVRNKVWKTSNKSLILLDVAGFDMQNKYK